MPNVAINNPKSMAGFLPLRSVSGNHGLQDNLGKHSRDKMFSASGLLSEFSARSFAQSTEK
jgi:hypothetical protein